jgi:hypothetical protein
MTTVGFGAYRIGFVQGALNRGAVEALDHRMGQLGPNGWWNDDHPGRAHGLDNHHRSRSFGFGHPGNRPGFGWPLWSFFPLFGIPFFLLTAGLAAGFFIWRRQQNR